MLGEASSGGLSSDHRTMWLWGMSWARIRLHCCFLWKICCGRIWWTLEFKICANQIMINSSSFYFYFSDYFQTKRFLKHSLSYSGPTIAFVFLNQPQLLIGFHLDCAVLCSVEGKLGNCFTENDIWIWAFLVELKNLYMTSVNYFHCFLFSAPVAGILYCDLIFRFSLNRVNCLIYSLPLLCRFHSHSPLDRCRFLHFRSNFHDVRRRLDVRH